MKRMVSVLIMSTLLLVPGMAAAQAPAQPPAEAPAAAPAPQQLQMQCVPGPGGTCVVPGAEQKKEMQGKMGQGCCMMQETKGCPRCQEVQKQLDDLRQRVEALEGQKKAKKK